MNEGTDDEADKLRQALLRLAPYFGDPGRAERLLAVVTEGLLESCREDLMRILADSERDPELRKLALVAFDSLEGSPDLDILSRVARDQTEDAGVREAAISALTNFGNDAVPILSLLFTGASDVEVKGAAAYALGAVGTDLSLRPLSASAHDRSESLDSRFLALEGLGFSHSREAANVLTSVLLDGGEPAGVRAVAAQSLGNLWLRDGVPALIAALKHPEADVRGEAANSLGALGFPEAIPGLEEATRTTSSPTWWGHTPAEEARAAIRSIQGDGGVTAASAEIGELQELGLEPPEIAERLQLPEDWVGRVCRALVDESAVEATDQTPRAE